MQRQRRLGPAPLLGAVRGGGAAAAVGEQLNSERADSRTALPQIRTTMTLLAMWTLVVLGVVSLARLPASTHGHGMHGMHAMATDAAGAPSKTEYKCPACRMSTIKSGYNNENWVELVNGQRVYACGMAPRTFAGYSFKSNDASYIGANMAEFIVSPSDTDEYVCTNDCPECADGIEDPISGAAVTTSNFKFVCLKNGQKIYFASAESRKKYLETVATAPRVAVSSMTCKGAACADSKQIETLSAKAQAFKPDAAAVDPAPGSSSGSPSTTPSAGSTSSSPAATSSTPSSNGGAVSMDEGFCKGEGSVMFNGFMSTIHGPCVKLFFHGWVLNKAWKYVLGFFGCMFLSLFNEFLVKLREWTRKWLLAARKSRPNDKRHKFLCKLFLAILYMMQMTIAYFAMLVVMIYESGLFIALIMGFGIGFMLLKDFDVEVTEERGVWRYIDPSVVRIKVEGMSCMKNCGTTVENALANTEGVTRAYVDFDEKCAYVAGVASFGSLIEAIEAVGFSASIDQHNVDTRNTAV